MLDPKLLRSDLDRVASNLAKRGFKVDVSLLNSLEKSRKELQIKAQELQNKRNTVSKEIGLLKRQNKECDTYLEEMGVVSNKLKLVENELTNIKDKLKEYCLTIPNIIDESVPVGKDENDNIVIRSYGEKPVFNFSPKEHLDLSSSKKLMDFSSSANLSGSRFVVLHKSLAKLHRVLGQFMLDFHTKEHGYEEVYVPFLVNNLTMENSGQLPKFEEDAFKINDTDLYLIPTAEVPVTNIVAGRIFDCQELPLKFVCHTPCFRKEAGSYGKDTTGMIRQHQFEKVELVAITEPDKSDQMLEELTGHAEKILQKLELPYRVVSLCSGDIGFCSQKTYDLEVWLPGQNKYREISSCSNCGDFQARRMQARMKINEKPTLAHTLNGSGLAVGRTLIAILENYQLENGNIRIPEALLPYFEPLTELSID
ncbi:MAG: serine--tRNA ligase [Legionellales bacterium]|nr:serine--tRNA ligase [Legionellales bacterium]